MNIVPHHHHSCEVTSSKIHQFFAEFHIGQILRSCNAYKLRGIAVMAIFLVAFEAVFQSRSFYQQKKDAPKSIPFERDTFYRFLNSYAIHWRKFTLLLKHGHHPEGHRAADKKQGSRGCPDLIARSA